MSMLTLVVFYLPPGAPCPSPCVRALHSYNSHASCVLCHVLVRTESGEKIALGITVMLAFSVLMLSVAEALPQTSEFVPLISARPCPALPCPALPCHAMPCPAMPCPASARSHSTSLFAFGGANVLSRRHLPARRDDAQLALSDRHRVRLAFLSASLPQTIHILVHTNTPCHLPQLGAQPALPAATHATRAALSPVPPAAALPRTWLRAARVALRSARC